MRRVLLALSFLGAATMALAAATPAVPPELEAARQALTAAVKAQDLKAIVAVSRFPLAFSGYEMPEEISKEDFLADNSLYAGLFFDGSDQIVACLGTTPLDYQDENPDFPGSPWVIDCDGNLYYFGEVDGAWRFTSYMNVNE
jgi:hypothetical protein